jgi:hypothetical protein
MADPMDSTPRSTASEEEKIQPTLNDPTPEGRKGDSRFLPVVILAAIALILILIGAVVLIRGKGHKIVPQTQDSHPSSSLVIQNPAAG